MSLDLYADENEPVAKYHSITYLVKIPDKSASVDKAPVVYVEVDEYGLVNVGGNSIWQGTGVGAQTSYYDPRSYHSRVMEIYDWLVEWELCEWKRIGPEDSELFATEKLVGEEAYAKLMLEG